MPKFKSPFSQFLTIGCAAGLLAFALPAIAHDLRSSHTGNYLIPHTHPPGEHATRATAPATAPAAPKAYCSEVRDGLMYLNKQMPAEASLGQEFEYSLNVMAMDCAANVVVTDVIPAGASFVRSEPSVEPKAGRVSWNLGQMDAGAIRQIRVWLRPDKEGTLSSCATIKADPRACASTFVGKAVLTLSKTGPETSAVGAEAAYNLVVANKGTSVARSVVVTDTIPDGLAHASGQRTLTFNAGDLQPNQSKSFPVVLKAIQRGKFCNSAEAVAANAAKVTAEACTTIQRPDLKVEKTGPKEQFLTRTAGYNIIVSNTGDTALHNVVVTDMAPAEAKIVSAEGATLSGGTAVWKLATLPAGAKQEFSVKLASTVPGAHCNGVKVTSAEGLAANAQACTVWRGISALLLEKGDNPDPIQIGEVTTYYVRVTNQGTADDTNIKVVVEFPKELVPASADHGGTVSGQTVTFPAFPRLAPKQAFEYRVTARGVQAGDARVKFIRTSTDSPAPTTAEESTRVY